MTAFSHERYNQLVKETVAEIFKLGDLKGGEYAGDTDQLANFRRLAFDQELPMSTIWRVYAGKHWDAISQYVKDERLNTRRTRLEPITGRIDDMLVYLMLLKAIIEEQNMTIGRESAQ